MRSRTATRRGAATLSLFPEYANKTLSDKSTVYQTAEAWESFTYDWLKDKARLMLNVIPADPSHALFRP